VAHTIDIDSFKEKIAGYNNEKASEFHRESAKMADQAYRLEVSKKPKQYKRIIFLCGGSATGKTEFSKTYLGDEPETTLIFDSTFSGMDGMKSKLSKVKNKYEVFVIFIQPSDLIKTFVTFTGRERKFHYSHFVRTHSGSRKIALYVLEHYDMVNFLYFISSIDERGKMNFKETIGTRDTHHRINKT
jgi:hypothetical protein